MRRPDYRAIALTACFVLALTAGARAQTGRVNGLVKDEKVYRSSLIPAANSGGLQVRATSLNLLSVLNTGVARGSWLNPGTAREPVDLRQQPGLRGGRQPEHRHDRRRADRDPERRQRGAQWPGAQPDARHAQTVTEIHRRSATIRPSSIRIWRGS